MDYSSQDAALATFLLNRRQLLLLAATLPVTALAEPPSISQNTEKSSWLDLKWQTIEAAQHHLFPSSNAFPGAREIQALHYLQQKFQRPFAHKKDETFLFKGVGWLNDLAQTDFKQTFIELTAEEKETLLRKVARSRAGGNWLTLIINNLIEALLTDPVYGGNPDGKGWQAVGHIPGYPKPSLEKRYFELGYQKRQLNRIKRTKA